MITDDGAPVNCISLTYFKNAGVWMVHLSRSLRLVKIMPTTSFVWKKVYCSYSIATFSGSKISESFASAGASWWRPVTTADYL